MISEDLMSAALADFLPKQRWFGAKDRAIREIAIETADVMWREWPALLRLEVGVTFADGDVDRYHIPVGLRPMGHVATFLEGNAESVVGEFPVGDETAFAYDAVKDSELATKLFSEVAPELETPQNVRVVGAEQSNTSIVYDETYIFKVFRKLYEDTNIDIEVTKALHRVGFDHIPEPVGEWTSSGSELGIIQRFLAGGAEGWAMAQTSMRDFFRQGGDPAMAGGDFGGEAERLGQTTAEMHHALMQAFGSRPADTEAWAGLMRSQASRVRHPDLDAEAAAQVFDQLASLSDTGPAIRVHGDYHLGQVMRTDQGWYILDFEGEPARPMQERRMFTSPLKDVAGMVRSFQYAAWSALQEQDTNPEGLAESWEQRNRQAFLEGYVAVAYDKGGLLPGSTGALEIILTAFELDKAIYELGYEQAHRPDWVRIPLDALRHLLKR